MLGQLQLPEDVRLPPEGVRADDVHLAGEDANHDNDDVHLLPGLPDDPQLLRHHHRLRHGPNLRIQLGVRRRSGEIENRRKQNQNRTKYLCFYHFSAHPQFSLSMSIV